MPQNNKGLIPSSSGHLIAFWDRLRNYQSLVSPFTPLTPCILYPQLSCRHGYEGISMVAVELGSVSPLQDPSLYSMVSPNF